MFRLLDSDLGRHFRVILAERAQTHLPSIQPIQPRSKTRPKMGDGALAFDSPSVGALTRR
jgi:hypothetical protein